MKQTPLSDLGEFALIKQLTKHIQLQQPSTHTGVGDDSAVLQFDEKVVISTDLLLEGIHFDLTYTPLKHLGFKSVSVNVSDIVAMNATPTQILLSIGLDKRFSLEMIEEFMEGVYIGCETYGVDLVGGDTTSSLTGLNISVTALGTAKIEDICYRSGAKENDLVCVSGDLGASYLGLQFLEREKILFEKEGIQPDMSGKDYILERQLKPTAKTDITKLLKKIKVKPTAMIDISDGLSSDILHICEESKVGCVLYEDKIPIDYTVYTMAEELNLNATTCALNGGEDYELLFTVNLADHDQIKNIPEIKIIGHITNQSKGNFLELRSGTMVELTAQGWNPIKKQ